MDYYLTILNDYTLDLNYNLRGVNQKFNAIYKFSINYINKKRNYLRSKNILRGISEVLV